jgi:hypothetical protein
MEQKNFSIIDLNSKELKDIKQFCELNKIEDVQKFMHTCFKQGYEIKKFGLLNPGKTGGIEEKWVEKEVIIEKRVEIPIEVIKEVEKIIEVPVEKIVTIYDNSVNDELLLKIQQLEFDKQLFSIKTQELEEQVQKFSTITTEMENIFQKEIIKEVLVQDTRAVDELLLERSVLKNKINELENKPIDNSKQKALEETIQKLRSELQLKNKEINDLKQIISEFKLSQDRQGIFLDGSNLNRTLNRK